MMNKFLLLIFSLLIISCSQSDNNDVGFVDNATGKFLDFIQDIKENSEELEVVSEEVRNAIDQTNDDAIETFSRIIIVRNEEELESLQIRLDVDSEGNTLGIASINYQFFQNDELNTYSYLTELNEEDVNPQSLEYSIFESTNTKLKVNMSGILSNYNTEDDVYTSVTFSDIDLNISF